MIGIKLEVESGFLFFADKKRNKKNSWLDNLLCCICANTQFVSVVNYKATFERMDGGA